MLDQHVTSLELSQKLKALGVPQKSEFCWNQNVMAFFDPPRWTVEERRFALEKPNLPHYPNAYAAFLSSELGEMLTHRSWTEKGDKKWRCFAQYWDITLQKDSTHFRDSDTEANARGKMLIFLIEQKIVKTSDL